MYVKQLNIPKLLWNSLTLDQIRKKDINNQRQTIEIKILYCLMYSGLHGHPTLR